MQLVLRAWEYCVSYIFRAGIHYIIIAQNDGHAHTEFGIFSFPKLSDW